MKLLPSLEIKITRGPYNLARVFMTDCDEKLCFRTESAGTPPAQEHRTTENQKPPATVPIERLGVNFGLITSALEAAI